MAIAVTLIAKKREVAIRGDGFSVERMSRGPGREMPGSVNLTASHCTNHIFCQRADKRVYQKSNS